MNNLFESVKLKDFKIHKTPDRTILLENIMYSLGIDKKYFKGLLFQTKQLTDREIQTCFDSARQFKKNPPALFRKLIKAKLEELKPKPYQALLGCKCDYCNYYREKVKLV